MYATLLNFFVLKLLEITPTTNLTKSTPNNITTKTVQINILLSCKRWKLTQWACVTCVTEARQFPWAGPTRNQTGFKLHKMVVFKISLNTTESNLSWRKSTFECMYEETWIVAVQKSRLRCPFQSHTLIELTLIRPNIAVKRVLSILVLYDVGLSVNDGEWQFGAQRVRQTAYFICLQ